MVKKLAIALFNVVLLSAIVYSASFSFATAQQNIQENSIFYHLLVKSMSVSSSGNALEINTEATGLLYLLKNETEVRTGATVTYEVPLINDKKTLTETSTGIYSMPIAEKFIITPESAALDVKNLKIIPKEITVHINGIEKYNSQVSGAGNISVLDYIENYSAPPNTSVTGFIDNIQISTLEIATYRIPVEIIVRQEVLNNGTPLSGTSLAYSLPNHNYRQTVVTDTNGIADVRINETVLLTISNGTITQLAEPVQLPAESDVVAFWWGDGGGGGGGGCTANSLSVSVSQDRSQYVQNEWVKISGTVKDNCGNTIDNADVRITISEDWLFGSTLKTESVTSGSDGSYSYDYLIPGDAKSGQYRIEAYATKSGYSTGSSSTNFWVIAQPKIKEIMYSKYLEKYKSKGNNIVFNRGKTSETTVWLEGDVVKDKHNIRLDISDPSSVNTKFVKWTTRSDWLGLVTYQGAIFEMEIPAGNPVGKYKLDAKLYYNSNTGQRDLSGIDGGSLTSNFNVIFNPYSTGLTQEELENYVYKENSNRDESAVYFTAEEAKIHGRWMGRAQGELKEISPFSDEKFTMAINEIQGGTSVENALIKLRTKARSTTCGWLCASDSLYYASLMTELSRSAGIPARIATVDANEGLTIQSHFQITEVYVNEWLAVDALNNVGPISRAQMAGMPDYSEANNDEILIAKSNWNGDEVGDWW